LKYGTYSLYRTITEEVSGTANTSLKEANCTSTEVASQLGCLSALPAYTLANLPAQTETLTVDGTYITTPELVLMGVMRDEAGAAITWPPTTANFSAFMLQEGFNATPVQNVGYIVPNCGNATLGIFNVSVRVDTDGEWRCRDLQQCVQKHLLVRIQLRIRVTAKHQSRLAYSRISNLEIQTMSTSSVIAPKCIIS
jgi:hypothetical protein